MAASNSELAKTIQSKGNMPAVSKAEAMLVNIWKSNQRTLQNLCGDQKQALKLMSTVTALMDLNPSIMECTPISICNCILQSASTGFWPVGSPPLAYYVKYGTTCTFIPSYQAYITRMYESGYVRKVLARVVWEADHFEHIEGSDERVIHRTFRGPRKERGERVAVYCITKNKYGEEELSVLYADDIEDIKAKSAAVRYGKGPWMSDNSMEVDSMWLKSAVRHRWKLLPKSEKDTFLDSDDENVVTQGIGLDPQKLFGDSTQVSHTDAEDVVVSVETGEVTPKGPAFGGVEPIDIGI